MRKSWIVLCALLWGWVPAFAAVNANTASVDELRTVAGIGPAIAQRIVEERRRAPYASLDDLQARVRGVGEASVRRMAAAGLVVGNAGAVVGTAGLVVGNAGRAAPAASDGAARARPEVVEVTARTRPEPRVATTRGAGAAAAGGTGAAPAGGAR